MREKFILRGFTTTVKIKLSEHNNPVKIFHVRDIENLKDSDNLEEFIKNS